MEKKNTNYHALSELARFAAGAEGELDQLEEGEIERRLALHGINTADLAKRTQNRLKRIHNELATQPVAEKLLSVRKITLSAQQMMAALNRRGVPVAARADGSISDEDIEIVYRLTFLEGDEDGGTEA